MSDAYQIDRSGNTLFDATGRRFDAERRRWLAATKKKSAGKLEELDSIAAVNWLQRESSYPLREPIGVIGPRAPPPPSSPPR